MCDGTNDVNEHSIVVKKVIDMATIYYYKKEQYPSKECNFYLCCMPYKIQWWNSWNI